MHYRFATMVDDAPALATLNHALIRDEGETPQPNVCAGDWPSEWSQLASR